MAEFVLLFDFMDGDGRNLDVVPLDDGEVQVRIFGAGKYTTTRSVVLSAELVLSLQLALAAHVHAATTEAAS